MVTQLKVGDEDLTTEKQAGRGSHLRIVSVQGDFPLRTLCNLRLKIAPLCSVHRIFDVHDHYVMRMCITTNSFYSSDPHRLHVTVIMVKKELHRKRPRFLLLHSAVQLLVIGSCLFLPK